MSRDVGGLGEATLQAWCHERGLIFNRAARDRGGWDYLIEFPHHSDAELHPLDRVPGPAQVRIQVKATDRTARRWSVKLSNWIRLVKSPLPAFFLVMEFDGTSNCGRAFLVHVGEVWIRKVLKRLRELSALGQTDALHKRTLDLTYSEDELLESPSGAALARAVDGVLGDNYDAYRAQKERLLREVGYEEVQARLDIKFKLPKSDRERNVGDLLVDFAIGAVSKLEVVEAEVWDERFGIPVLQPDSPLAAGGELTIERTPALEGTLLLRSLDEGLEVRVPARAFGPAGVSHLVDESLWKIRVEIPGGSIVLAPNASSAQLKFSVPNPEDSLPIDELADIARLLNFYKQITGKFRIWLGDDSLGLGEIDDLVIPPSILDWCEIVLMARHVTSFFELPPDTSVSVRELWEQNNVLKLLSRATRGDTSDLSITTKFNEAVTPQNRICFPALHDLAFGAYRLLCGAAYIGPVPEDGPVQEISFAVAEIRILKKLALRRQEPLPAPPHETLAEIAASFEDSHDVVVWWEEAP